MVPHLEVKVSILLLCQFHCWPELLKLDACCMMYLFL